MEKYTVTIHVTNPDAYTLRTDEMTVSARNREEAKFIALMTTNLKIDGSAGRVAVNVRTTNRLG